MFQKKINYTYEGCDDQKFGHISFSQWNQDLFLINLFHKLGIDKPSYLDLGAHHPIRISNSHLFYLHGGRGVNVEANPAFLADFLKHRPEDFTAITGVGAYPRKSKFYMDSETGIINGFDKKSFDLHEKKVLKEIDLQIESLEYIIHNYCNWKFPDLLLCDIEGMDYEVIESIPSIKAFKYPKIICVESPNIKEMEALLYLIDYFPICTIGSDIVAIDYDTRKDLF